MAPYIHTRGCRNKEQVSTTITKEAYTRDRQTVSTVKATHHPLAGAVRQ